MDAGVRNPLVQQHLRVRMYPDRTYMYAAFSPVVIEKIYFHDEQGRKPCRGKETRDGGIANHSVPGDGGLELFSYVPRIIV
jgi:hypothetical protein